MNRFTREIKRPELNQRLTDTMIRPIAENALIIWGGRNMVLERKFDAILHRSTRSTLRLPYFHLARRYMPFNERLKRLGTLTFHGRLALVRCITAVKIEKGNFETAIRSQLLAARAVTTMEVRHARRFNVPMGRQTCVSRMLTTYNKLRQVINRQHAVTTNKFKIKKFLLTNQFNVTKDLI